MEPDPQAIVVDEPETVPMVTVNGTDVDGQDESKMPPSNRTPTAEAGTNNAGPNQISQSPAGESSIDIIFEASKLPLDVAIFNSARAAGGDEKIRKYLQAVLVIGGVAHTPGMGHALESRFVP